MESESRGKAKISRGGTQLETETYALLPIDLRVSPPTGHSTTKSSSQTLDALVDYVDTSIPTLIIAECVFCYMAPKESADVLSWFASKFENAVAVVYEMCGLE
jgi:[phosphatase 2A protein]-leucine-carboxy methyltransferase